MKEIGKCNSRTFVILGLLYIGLAGFFVTTNPDNLPAAMLILPALWMYGAFYLSLLTFASLVTVQLGMARWKVGVYCAIAAGVPTLLLVLRSLDQLTVKDSALLLIMTIVTVFYVGRLRFVQKTDTT